MATYPFSEINGRMFYACMGVFVVERNTQTGDTTPTNGVFLPGVSSVGVNSSFPSTSLLDVGRAQRTHHFYAPQDFEISIDRVLDQSADFFYHVDPTNYIAGSTGYKKTHILFDENIGCQGGDNPNSKSLKNYDITILYGPDRFDRLGSEIDSGTDADKDKVFSVTYRNCLITSIGYSIATEGAVTESITLTTRGATYNDGYQTASDYTLPTQSSAQSGDLIRKDDFDLLASSPNSILPTEVVTMFKAKDSSGDFDTLNDKFILGINSISIDITIDYSDITDVGKWAGSIDQGEQNIWRYVNLPVGVSVSFTGTPRQPFVQSLPNTDTTFSTANGVRTSTDWTRVDREIRLVAEKFPSPPTTTYFVWDLGKSNYLTDLSFSGGDTGGGNLEATMSYQNDASDIVLVKDTSIRELPKPDTPY